MDLADLTATDALSRIQAGAFDAGGAGRGRAWRGSRSASRRSGPWCMSIRMR